MAINLQRNNFEKWLSDNSNKVVGISSDQCWCPLATYLQITYNSKSVIVSKSNIFCKKVRIPSSKWIKEFISQIDKFESKRISGRDALEILQRIK